MGKFFISEKPVIFRAKNATVSIERSGTDYCWLYCGFTALCKDKVRKCFVAILFYGFYFTTPINLLQGQKTFPPLFGVKKTECPCHSSQKPSRASGALKPSAFGRTGLI